MGSGKLVPVWGGLPDCIFFILEVKKMGKLEEIKKSAEKQATEFISWLAEDWETPGDCVCDPADSWAGVATESVGFADYMAEAGIPADEDGEYPEKEASYFWSIFEVTSAERAIEARKELAKEITGYIGQIGTVGAQDFAYTWAETEEAAQSWCDDAWEGRAMGTSPYCGVSKYSDVCEQKYKDGTKVYVRPK